MGPGMIAPGVENIMPSTDIETTPEFFSSDNNNSNSNRSASDQPSPAALNSMSGPSYAGPQQPFTTASTAATTTQIPTPNDPLDVPPSASTSDPSNGTDPSQFNGQPSVSVNGQIYRNTPQTPFFTTGPEPSFAMPSPPNWDFSASQPFAPSPSNMTPGTSGPFNEAQFEQLVSGNNWGVWRG